MKTTTFILILGFCSLIGFSQKGNISKSYKFDVEKAAIMESINAETAAFFKRDYEEVIKYFVHTDYAFQSWNNADGTFSASIGWPAIDQRYTDLFKVNSVPVGTSAYPVVEKRNMIVKFFNSNLAFVTWDQYESNYNSKIFRKAKAGRII